MWAFLSKRLRMWLILAVAAPVVGWLLGKVGDLIEKRRGPNAVSRTLHQGRGWLQRRTKGPLSAKPDSERPAR
ncbi:MAG: hypothetical protein JWP64_1717 [Pseudonocardia sp.]|jgi:hypothetical protein|uniref:hypothetical protein n=1 Tax=Pseudonocardia sp. TaxID=60912 RepID=UPI00260D3DAC|nr:hypothetical protein [Pseudonocardia sp.]MCU1626768.1 hypothetical protein [Pseudonocardia sp.]MDT7701642.1 hypothetical protein [Pseudonocardiales bacterium]